MGKPIPPLRDDLEVEARPNGSVDVRDPLLLQVFTINRVNFETAKEFDGLCDAKEVQKKCRAAYRAVSRHHIKSIAKEFRELFLLETPEVWDQKPNFENVTPYSQAKGTRKVPAELPVAHPDARWDCTGCGHCCHGLAVELTTEEESRIDLSLYGDVLGDEHFAENQFIDPDEKAKRVLRQDENDACIFLAPDGLCYVHARQGMEAKPDACQIFPNMVLKIRGQPARLGLRLNCASMHETFADGPEMSNQAEHVKRILQTSGLFKAPKKVRFFGKKMPFSELDALCQKIEKTFATAGVSAEIISQIDDRYLEGRAKAVRSVFGKKLLKYIKKESDGECRVEEGSLRDQVDRLARGRVALKALRNNQPPPRVSEEVESFLKCQIRHAMYLCAPLGLPDSSHALICFLLLLEAALHAIGPSGDLATASTAILVFTGPLFENPNHSWPMLEAIDPQFAEALRKDL